ncbi:MAG: UDP-3-O-(3-hydroxymyristoyl)glucosamine N-acyltransferase [Verrucomicrobiaceae bacterium]|nr:UDP-3-O-(3-hydroxymyristoyl)glucosamine N-acyltransferase [Verrucomicrobiaceae bacterium]
MSTKITQQKIAEIVGGKLTQGDPAAALTGLNSVAEANSGEITFLGNLRYLPTLKSTHASCVLVAPGFNPEDAPEGIGLIEVENPTLAFSAVIREFAPPTRRFITGVHPSATVAASAVFDPQKVSIGPGVVIEDDVVVGDGTAIHPGAVIGMGTRIGSNCVIHANVTLKDRTLLADRVIIHSGTVIGTDGFGYEFTQGQHKKIDQLGIVQIDNDVEIGSCTTIDRARFGRTWIGEGTKIDNLVQIGHNCIIGKHCIIVSQTGISGSTRIGDFVTMGGQVGVAGHLEISSRVMLFAKSGVTKSLKEPGAYTGYPARPLMEGRKMLTYPAKVPELIDRVRALEERLASLEEKA